MNTRCGYVAIIGRPNVGKSTLLNHLLGQKLSITSRKPQTTRHRLLGIKTEGDNQIIYVDTPGLHQDRHTAMNRYLNRTASSSIEDVDVVVWLLEAMQWTEQDQQVLKLLEQIRKPVILAINKIDRLQDKSKLLPFLQEASAHYAFSDIFPISALRNDNLQELEQKIIELLPLNSHVFEEDDITDRSERFLVAEIVREKLVRTLGAELPYRLTVQTEHFKHQDDGLLHISTVVWVEKASQKGIIIGKQGKKLKAVGEAARKDINELLGCKTYLQLWVKVKENWSNSEEALQQLGYKDEL
ncbi:GTPase Era [Candidatus Albibeggiatoa sp. nov. NOAA]|uniref:GTPase Era n=1 Tax=Candidatus Albibeggiatoa sp. nov. NOAA TaxID=3162724 RepID=UPI0033011175|nr:GTPase Era [Thiotrichaceae bacterium]